MKEYFIMITSGYTKNAEYQKETNGVYNPIDTDIYYGSFTSDLRGDDLVKYAAKKYDLSEDVFYLQEVIGPQK